MAVLVKTPERIRKVCEDIVQHFQTKVEPNGFKGQIVTFDRESCLLLQGRAGQAAAARGHGHRDVGAGGDEGPPGVREAYDRTAMTRRTAAGPLPRPGRPAEADHRHRQAADRLRRAHPAGDVPGQAAARPHAAAGHLPGEPHLLRAEDPRPDRGLPRHLRRRGKALEFDEKSVKQVVSNIQELKDKLPEAMQKCLAFFAGCDRSCRATRA
jgi:type I restriction enzyme, R subunit